MQVNKYIVAVKLDCDFTFHVTATSDHEAGSLVMNHITKIHERQWEAPHAAPGITLIEESNAAFMVKAPKLVVSENP